MNDLVVFYLTSIVTAIITWIIFRGVVFHSYFLSASQKLILSGLSLSIGTATGLTGYILLKTGSHKSTVIGSIYEISDTLSLAKLGFHIPDTMTLGESHPAIVYVSKSDDRNVLVLRFAKLRQDKYLVVDSIKVSSTVRVQIRDHTPDQSEFQVDTTETSWQHVGSQIEPTRWRFEITPLKRQNRGLQILVSTLEQGKPRYLEFREEGVKVFVKSNHYYYAKKLLESTWESTWGQIAAILVPLLAAGITIWPFMADRIEKKRTRKDSESKTSNSQVQSEAESVALNKPEGDPIDIDQGNDREQLRRINDEIKRTNNFPSQNRTIL